MNTTVATGRLDAPHVYPDDDRKVADTLEPSIIHYVWQVFWRNRLLTGGIILLALALATVVTLLATPLYTSTAQLQINRISDNLSEVDNQERKSETLQYEEFYSTQYALLESTTLAERVARKLNLPRQDEFIEAFDIADDSPVVAGNSEDSIDATARILLDSVAVSPVRGSSLVNISFTSPSPELSQRIAATWVDEFIALSLERRFAATSDARDFLQDRLAELRERLEESERQFVAYAADSGIFAVTEGSQADGESERTTLASANLARMNEALAQARADRIAAGSAMQAGSDKGSDALLTSLRQQRATVAAERAALLAQFDEGYPPIQALSNQLREIDKAIGTAQSGDRSDLQRTYQAALRREQGLEQQVNQLKGAYRDEQNAGVQYNILRREVDTNRELYNGLLQRYKEIGVAGVEASRAQLVDAPQVPDEPSSPNLPLNLAVGLLLGICIAGGVLFVREQVDRSLRDPNDVTNVLGIPLLGTTPRQPAESVLDELADRKSAMSEAYLSIGTMLDLSTEHGFPRLLMLTSASPSEGKTSSSYALASRLARRGRKTILVDFDLRNPSLGRRIDLPNEKGVVHYLTGEEDLAGLIQSSGSENLSVLTAGPIPPSPGELITSDRTPMLLDQLTKHYDHVIVDSAPVMGIADAPVLASLVEGVIFVIEANRVGLRQLSIALSRLKDANATILGAIVTKLDNRNTDYGYGYGYGYGAQSRADAPEREDNDGFG